MAEVEAGTVAAADVRLPDYSGNKEGVIETKSADGDIEALSILNCEQY